MAKQDKKLELRQKSKFAAMEGLRPHDGLPLPPRTAMKQAKRASKKLAYPVPPYAGVLLPVLLMDAKKEWDKLGRWQRVAAPAVVLVSLLTWEQEAKKREQFQAVVERRAAKTTVAELYGQRYLARPPGRKLFGLIPLPGKKKW
jgi:hypothetical protein